MNTSFGSNLKRALHGLGEPVVLALGVTQTLGYGTLYYAFGVLAPAMSRDFGVGLDVFFAAFSAGLLTGGLFAPRVGRALDRHGARKVMTLGSAFAAAALLAAATAGQLWLFIAAVVLMEFAGCLVLYESAFAGLVQIHGAEARQRITAVSLIAGLASTISWPLTQGLLLYLDWRWIFVIFALAHLFVCLPLHHLMLKQAGPGRPQGVAGSSPVEPAQAVPTLEGRSRTKALILYTTAICVSGFAYSSFPVHMLRIIENEGFSAQTAALFAMIMGPAQVMARLIEISFGQRFDALTTGRFALGALLASILLLSFSNGTVIATLGFAALYGVSQGLITIARGTVPLLIFGAAGYATLVGKVTGLRLVVNAIGPFLFAAAATRFGMGPAVWLNGLAALIAVATFMLLQRPVPRKA